MGLLTNPQTREKITKIISKYNNKLCFICYVVGVLYFGALAHKELNAGTYFSENALLPGLVEPDFYSDFGASGHFQSLKEEVKSRKDPNNKNSQGVNIPTDWIVTRMRELGLDTHVQNFSFSYPDKLLKDQVFQGQNVYAILRAPRLASTEAVVMSAPYRPFASPYEKTNAGIAMILGMAKAFRRHTYWAKDIIFLITEHEQLGMQAWLDAYHNTENQFIHATELAGRSGPIQAAINLELATDTLNRLNVKMEGLNGQLPNLDLVNLVGRLCMREQIPMTIHKRTNHPRPTTPDGYFWALNTMLMMMWHQAPGTPTGNHGLFHRYRIEAITLEGFRSKDSKRTVSFKEFGKVLEGVYRSLNNLLERFHQSFFFYLLPATDRYISIGVYMPPFGIMALPVLIKAIALWISHGIHVENEADKAKEKKDKQDTSADGSSKESPKTDTNQVENVGDTFGTVLTLIPTCSMAVFFGLGAYFSPRYFIETASALHTKPQEGLLFGNVAILMAVLLHPSILRSKADKKGHAGPDWQLLKCVGLLAFSAVLALISVMNISLAFFVALVWVPVFVSVRPTNSRILRFIQHMFLFLVSPAILLVLACVIQHTVVSPLTDMSTLAPTVLESTQDALLVSIIDTSFYGTWTYGIVTLTLLPTWCLFWSLMWTRSY